MGLATGTAFAAAHSNAMVEAMDQDVSNSVVSADKVMATENGWMVVHRTDAEMKPGPVVGYAPLRAGENVDVAAILQEEKIRRYVDAHGPLRRGRHENRRL